MQTKFKFDGHFCLVFEMLDVIPLDDFIRNLESQTEVYITFSQ